MTQYDSVNQFFARHHLFRRDGDKWRATKPVYGEINGLPNLAGWLVATNGILCYLETETGEVHEGHITWFVPDKKDAVIVDVNGEVIANPSGLRTSKHEKILTELMKLIRT